MGGDLTHAQLDRKEPMNKMHLLAAGCFMLVLAAVDSRAADRVQRTVAETLLLYQRDNGGWPKNFEWDERVDDRKKEALVRQKGQNDTTIDNGATHKEIRYLAQAYAAFNEKRYRQAALRGITFLQQAQYGNGGWPQTYPQVSGYHRHITFNDGAMIGVMSLFRDIATGKPEFGFVDSNARRRSAEAVQKGIRCVLRCQIVVAGEKTAWCAQHDEKTLEPRKARSYELASLSGAESVKIVEFLMGVDNPTPAVREAIKSAVMWFDQVKIVGMRVKTIPAPDTPKGRDRVVVPDAAAPPLWARFYEIETNRPFYCSRDGVPKYRLSEISYERRNGYSWLGEYAKSLLTKNYPAWQKRVAK